MPNFCCGMFTKTMAGTYTWVSQALLELHGLSQHDILGKKDNNLPWSQHTKILRLHDEEIFDTKAPAVFKEVITRRGRSITGYCHKSPLFGADAQLIGVAGIFIDAPVEPKPLIKLSMREKQCLNNLVTGLTAQESAERLNLSRRTVEGYLEQLRLKYHCKNQAQLIALYWDQYRP